ncbi:unnamed protein product [Rotaria sordida]|uniref:NAD(P)(+)--arginine ADP-ribosyltransferase n=1 Tax=Rotaria sordida TaxID=392033 RepID=A0A815CQT6_9BILA|nr:unnamed protein product [Rotaria sordida]CAF1265831.1 unnamed protein product [Rotaria sordida]CAF1286119.1 unnamed protein product [Rotaria sordida]CAF1436108.1 unnamed protein product [Rotaria sordida]CAF3922937.1 unnamed protein product [Rotaria sordida]
MTSEPKSSTISNFYYACRNGQIDKVREQLRIMTVEEVDQIQANGSTALHAACYYGHTEIVKLLLDRGASRSIQNEHKCLPYDETEKDEIKQLFLRKSQTRFSDDGSGHIDWMKCDDKAESIASDYLYRHSGFGWQSKNVDYRLKYIKSEMSYTEKENIKRWIDQAEKDPFYLLKAYTVESDFYAKLNRDLATKHFDQGTNFGITFFIDFFYNHPAFKILSYKGRVYRGMTITQDDLKQYIVGGKVMNKAFMSTTKDRNIAEQFAKKDLTNRKQQHGANVKLSALCIYEIINDRTGLNIEDISEYRNEKEVLVGPYTAFKITAVHRVDSNYIEIDLQECKKVNYQDEDENDDFDDD